MWLDSVCGVYALVIYNLFHFETFLWKLFKNTWRIVKNIKFLFNTYFCISSFAIYSIFGFRLIELFASFFSLMVAGTSCLSGISHNNGRCNWLFYYGRNYLRPALLPTNGRTSWLPWLNSDSNLGPHAW